MLTYYTYLARGMMEAHLFLCLLVCLYVCGSYHEEDNIICSISCNRLLCKIAQEVIQCGMCPCKEYDGNALCLLIVIINKYVKVIMWRIQCITSDFISTNQTLFPLIIQVAKEVIPCGMCPCQETITFPHHNREH